MRILTLYLNCSLGGMTSVYLNRCLSQPNDKFDFIFVNDKGGKEAFLALPNAEVRIVKKDRLSNYLEHALSQVSYDEIRLTSLSTIPALLKRVSLSKIIYEFHTSSLDIIKRELNELSLNSVDEIWAPSLYLKSMIESNLDLNKSVKVVRNLANPYIFSSESEPSEKYQFPSDEVPIFWIGRFDKGKNYKDFFRALSLLEKKYVGYVILSMENDPNKYADAIGDLNLYGLNDRVKFFLNLTQHEVADLYKNSRSVQGIFCSTSLAESFGYGVLEAAMAGLPVVAYEVGGLAEHLDYGYDINMINVGDTVALANCINTIHSTT